MQKAGETCGNCLERWVEQDLPSVKLVALPTRGERYNEEIAVCPYCDGEVHEVAIAALKREVTDAPES